MADDLTREMGDGRSFEERLFARLDAIETRMEATNVRVDARFDAIETRLATVEENAGNRFALIDLRFSKLEDLVDSRLKETQPIWEGMQFEMRRLNAKFEQYVEDLFDLRAAQKTLRKRVDVLEGITN